MEQPELNEPGATVSASGRGAPGPISSVAKARASSPAPVACPNCGVAPAANGGAAATPSYVYAIGTIEARFPRASGEKEFVQATGRAETAGKTDRQVFQEVLSQKQNRYLTRQLCWVMTIEGLETYILI